MMRFSSGIYVVLLLAIKFSLVQGDPLVPCYFIFGDSLSDAGNNNPLITTAKANYAPYGVDFPGGVAGRFTNEFTVVDMLTQLLGFQGLIQPFTTASGADLLKGVNYASGAAGIRPETGSHLGDRIWLAKQLTNHGVTIGKLQLFVQGPVSNYLNKCLYTVNIGSDDYINNYFMPQYYASKSMYNPDQYATSLITDYGQQLQVLYGYGARKITLIGLGQIGCTPAEMRMNNVIGCVTEVNDAVKLFNQKLKQLVDTLNAKLPGAMFTFIDTIAMQTASPLPPGTNVLGTCCQVRGDYQCEPLVPPCPDRTKYAFMDGYHPTQILNEQAARSAFMSPSPLFVHPVDISQLVSSPLL